MLKDFLAFINKEQLFARSDKILVGVSGGADSGALLDLLCKIKQDCAIAHCNFHLRDAESDKDAKLVEELARKYTVAFFKTDFDTRKYALQQKISIEMAARDLRYRWFEKIRSQNRFDYIAVAHHKNDQIETLILNLIRGTGIKGIAGMKPKNNRIVRPLLFATQNEVLNYIAQNNLQYRNDASNDDIQFVRNRIRHQIIPELMQINTSVENTLAENMQHFREVNEIYQQQIENVRKKLIVSENNKQKIDIEKLKTYRPLKTYLFELISPYGFFSSQTDEVLQLLDSQSGKKCLSASHQIIKNRNELIILPLSFKAENNELKITEAISQTVKLPDNQTIIVKITKRTKDFKINPSHNKVYIDLDKIQFPLTFRKWQTGDYFVPFGMSGRKKISDFFTDCKLSIAEKQTYRIGVSNSGEIFWIAPLRADNRFRIDKKTTRILTIEFIAN